jgi:hypothetical protein
MSRIPRHTVNDAPAESKDLLQDVTRFSPTGLPLNLHAQLATAPAVLHAYVALRRAPEQHSTLSAPVRIALMLATAGAVGNDYTIAIVSMLAARAGWSTADIASIRSGRSIGDAPVDALAAAVREAASAAGRVRDQTWSRAVEAWWEAHELADAFGALALTAFTAYFCNYAETELDVPVEPQPVRG